MRRHPFLNADDIVFAECLDEKVNFVCVLAQRSGCNDEQPRGIVCLLDMFRTCNMVG